ncbi:hypothetical protein MJO28_000370 [Puccinia striiformis f. sp. tritici]|uniref:Uncharacterized protein n=1 Tax=Puccinia striiformis f. sp. tritici TaxID=168172 RepID=A0ACC0EXN9_9BASI|nr:hypothetical protein MJO28_000370 [Puccinia striiformis f. sp. tritici]
MNLPYSNLPNTRPRISSPLAYELTYKTQQHSSHSHHDNLSTATTETKPKHSTGLITLFCLCDALLFFNLARTLTPFIQRHLNALLLNSATPFSHLLSDLLSTPLPTELIVPSLAFIKSLSGFCLLHTGSTIRSYSINSLMVYTLLASSICLSSERTSVSLSILICLLVLVLSSIVICLPLLRLTQVLLDIEDQQAFQANRLTLKSSSLYRKHTSSSSRQSNKLSPQARYQHLMNPF